MKKYSHSDEPYSPITQGILTYCQVVEAGGGREGGAVGMLGVCGGGGGDDGGGWLSGCSGTPGLNLEPMMNTDLHDYRGDWETQSKTT